MKSITCFSILLTLAICGVQAFAVIAVSTDLELRRGEDVRKAMTKQPAGYYVKAFNDKESLLIASMGQMMNGGYSISIKKATETDDRISVEVFQSAPGPNDMVTMALTWPQDAVAIKKSTKPVVFNVEYRTGKVSEKKSFYIPIQVFKGFSSKKTELSTQTIISAKAFDSFWMKLGIEMKMAPIDFTKYMAVAILSGDKMVEIAEVVTEGGTLHINYILKPPAETKTKNNSYVVAIIPLFIGKVYYEEVIEKPNGEMLD